MPPSHYEFLILTTGVTLTILSKYFANFCRFKDEWTFSSFPWEIKTFLPKESLYLCSSSSFPSAGFSFIQKRRECLLTRLKGWRIERNRAIFTVRQERVCSQIPMLEFRMQIFALWEKAQTPSTQWQMYLTRVMVEVCAEGAGEPFPLWSGSRMKGPGSSSAQWGFLSMTSLIILKYKFPNTRRSHVLMQVLTERQ